MAKPDKHQKQARRARGQVETELARGRTGEAVDAWLSLPASERASLREPVAQAVRHTLQALVERHDTVQAAAWLGRWSRDRSLLEDTAPQRSALRWLLLLAALRTRQWPVTLQLWAELAVELPESPIKSALAPALTSRGSQISADLESLLSAEAVRLGRELPRPRISYPIPETPEQAERTCLACFTSEPFARFRELLGVWLKKTTPEIAFGLRVLAGSLAERELLQRHDDAPRALEVAGFCARLALDVAGAAPLERSVTLALRVAARVLERAALQPSQTRICFQILQAAQLYPALRPFLGPLLLAADLDDHADADLLPLVRAALEHEPSAALVLRAAWLVHELDSDESGCAHIVSPSWFVAAVEHMLDAGQVDLGAALDESGHSDSHELVHALLGILPIPLAVRVVSAAWPSASHRARQLLASVSDELVVRMRRKTAPADPRAARAKALSQIKEALGIRAHDATLDAILESNGAVDLIQALDGSGGELPTEMLPLWHELERLVLAYDVAHLETALELVKGRARELELVRRFWTLRPTLVARFKSLHDANDRDYTRAEQALQRHVFDGLVCGAVDAANALEAAERAGAPRKLRKQIYAELVRAVEREPALRTSASIAQTLRRGERQYGSVRRGAAKGAGSRPERGTKASKPARKAVLPRPHRSREKANAEGSRQEELPLFAPRAREELQ